VSAILAIPPTVSAVPSNGEGREKPSPEGASLRGAGLIIGCWLPGGLASNSSCPLGEGGGGVKASKTGSGGGGVKGSKVAPVTIPLDPKMGVKVPAAKSDPEEEELEPELEPVGIVILELEPDPDPELEPEPDREPELEPELDPDPERPNFLAKVAPLKPRPLRNSSCSPGPNGTNLTRRKRGPVPALDLARRS